MDKLKIEVAGQYLYIDPEKIKTGDFLQMMRLMGEEKHSESGVAMIQLMLDSMGAEQLNGISLVTYPFLADRWMQAIMDSVFVVGNVQTEIDEIVARQDSDENK